MKKIKVTITQELELPDECELVDGVDGKLIKYKNTYLNPGMEFTQSDSLSDKSMQFIEISEQNYELLFGAVVEESKDISEV